MTDVNSPSKDAYDSSAESSEYLSEDCSSRSYPHPKRSTMLDNDQTRSGKELVLACLYDSEEQVKQCLEKRKLVQTKKWRKTLDTAFAIATKLNHIKAATALRDHFQWRGFVDFDPSDDLSLLELAMLDRNWIMAKLLLETGSQVPKLKKIFESRNHRFGPILGHATLREPAYTPKQETVIYQLMEAGVSYGNLAASEQHEDALQNAISVGSLSVVEALLHPGFRPQESHVQDTDDLCMSAEMIRNRVAEARQKRTQNPLSKKRKFTTSY